MKQTTCNMICTTHKNHLYCGMSTRDYRYDANHLHTTTFFQTFLVLQKKIYSLIPLVKTPYLVIRRCYNFKQLSQLLTVMLLSE